MKTKLIHLSLLATLTIGSLFAQEKTTVTAKNSDISDNLDLRAVATVFGDAKDLEDFENRINDPKAQLSNLDLNNDNYVDYLRVIESVEGDAHLIIIQSVLEKDLYQDVATIEVEKDRNNNMQVQVVGDPYMYGNNFIYEPVYVHSPLLFSYFWAPNYRIYYSRWNWGYYPRFYNYWRPFPIYRYNRNVRVWINYNNHYNYVNIRRSSVAINLHRNIRANSYELRNPERSFERRNNSVSNRYELDQIRTSTRNNRSDNNNVISPRTTTRTQTPRNNSQSASPRQNTRTDAETPRNQPESNTPRGRQNNEQTPRNSSPRENRNSNSRR